MSERREQPRTHYIHRLSYTQQERITGAFVLVALFILIGLLLSSGKTSTLFEEYLTIYGELQSIQVINKDTEITISGLPAGSVSSVDITDENKLVITMKILKKYHNLLREDSKAKLSSFNFAVVQKSVIEISTGSIDKPRIKDGSTMQIVEAFNIEKLMANVEPIFAKLEDSILKMNNILSEIDPKKLGTILDNVNAITGQIQAGQGLIGKAIYDENFENNILAATENMRQASIKINLLLNDINQQIKNVPELLEKIGPLLNEADKTIKATQNIWPLSSAIAEDKDKETLISPEPAND